MARSPIEGYTRLTKQERSDRRHRSGDLLQRPGKKGRALDMVDRVATVVWLERLGMLEVEDEVRRGRQACRTTRLITVAKDLTSSPFSAHTEGCAGLVGLGVVTIFGYGVKLSERNKPRMCNIAHALSK